MSRNRVAPAPVEETRGARWRIRSWAALTVSLYGATLAVLLAPFGAAAFIGHSEDALQVAFDWYASWPFWVVIGGLMLAEALLFAAWWQMAGW